MRLTCCSLYALRLLRHYNFLPQHLVWWNCLYGIAMESSLGVVPDIPLTVEAIYSMAMESTSGMGASHILLGEEFWRTVG